MSEIEPAAETLDSSTDSGGEEVCIPATMEGRILADSSLLIMALLTIFFGALRSVHGSKSKRSEKEKSSSGEKPEKITSRDAARYPITASCQLIVLYLIFSTPLIPEMSNLLKSYALLFLNNIMSTETQELIKSHIDSKQPFNNLHLLFTRENLKLLLSLFITMLGVGALTRVVRPLVTSVFPSSVPNTAYHLLFTEETEGKKEEVVNCEFDTKSLVSLVLSSYVGVRYLFTKPWVANNMLTLALALEAVEQSHITNVRTGCILLGGLFVYDVFWVFGTNVMETVAQSFKAPIMLLFPVDLLEKGPDASNFSMLDLGDIVVPGIFIALLLRFDVSLKKNSRTYFYSSVVAYICGLIMTIFVMHNFNRSQPALLYLVPACVGVPVIVALVKGELKEMFAYEEAEEEAEEEANGEPKEEKKDQ